MKSSRPVGIWFLVSAFVVFAMAVIGAITRLTDSGLSIVDWHAVTDILPPQTQAQWLAAFAKYQTSPQYRLVTHGMSLDRYQHIYFWEWLHRLWGRVVLGAVLVLPFAYFGMRGYITRRKLRVIAVVFALGALQGFVGWFMVRSGLDQRPSVSQYRLAMHLAMALGIFAVLLWNGLCWTWPLPLNANPGSGAKAIRQHAAVGLGFVCTTMLWGAFVAGLHAGKYYNTFPKMDGYWIPPNLLYGRPAWMNFFANPLTVQFCHRVLAMSTALVLVSLGFRAYIAAIPVNAKMLGLGIIAGVVCQVTLGVSTLLNYVPVGLAAMHQAGAISVLTLVIVLLFLLRVPGGGALLSTKLAASKAPPQRTALRPQKQTQGSTAQAQQPAPNSQQTGKPP